MTAPSFSRYNDNTETSPERLQSDLDRQPTWSNVWKLVNDFKASKSKEVIFSPSRKPHKEYGALNLRQDAIPSDSHKHLGFILDKNSCTFN
jgi:hypothetical protein